MLKNKLFFALLFVGVSIYAAQTEGLRKNSLFDEENLKLKTSLTYLEKYPGESKLIERSFENAPPLIPHNIEGMLPITESMNTCISCHSPSVAKDLGAVPTPQTHMASFRPITNLKDDKLTKDGKAYINTSDVKTKAHARNGISADRFNCTQCHVPQTDNKPLVKNNFKADFRDKTSKNRSNLYEILNQGVEY